MMRSEIIYIVHLPLLEKKIKKKGKLLVYSRGKYNSIEF